MDAEFNNGPDDVAALRQALTAARAQALAAEQKHLDTVAELAVAKAMTSDDKALIAGSGANSRRVREASCCSMMWCGQLPSTASQTAGAAWP